ncbi:MAG: hypothetical protein ABR553_10215 [Gammaproteobacteria bacterium]
MSRISPLLLLIASLLLSGLAHALPRPEAVPGGVAVIELGAAEAAPRAQYQGTRVLVTRAQGRWYAVVGLPLTAEPGAHRLEVTDADGRRNDVQFEVVAKDYATQRLVIKDTRKVEPKRHAPASDPRRRSGPFVS